tara:strand:- start:131 stop:319 length:189 start_codon:yes stop_codon:yes gene_type:complete
MSLNFPYGKTIENYKKTIENYRKTRTPKRALMEETEMLKIAKAKLLQTQQNQLTTIKAFSVA